MDYTGKSMTSEDVLLHELSVIFWVPTRKMNGSLIMKEISQLMEEQCFFSGEITLLF